MANRRGRLKKTIVWRILTVLLFLFQWVRVELRCFFQLYLFLKSSLCLFCFASLCVTLRVMWPSCSNCLSGSLCVYTPAKCVSVCAAGCETRWSIYYSAEMTKMHPETWNKNNEQAPDWIMNKSKNWEKFTPYQS